MAQHRFIVLSGHAIFEGGPFWKHWLPCEHSVSFQIPLEALPSQLHSQFPIFGFHCFRHRLVHNILCLPIQFCYSIRTCVFSTHAIRGTLTAALPSRLMRETCSVSGFATARIIWSDYTWRHRRGCQGWHPWVPTLPQLPFGNPRSCQRPRELLPSGYGGRKDISEKKGEDKPEHAPTLSPLCPVSACPQQPIVQWSDCDSIFIHSKHLLDCVSRDRIAIPVDCPLRHNDDVQSLRKVKDEHEQLDDYLACFFSK